MAIVATAVDPTRCPVCGRANQCANEVERVTGKLQPPCWCTQASFSKEILEQLPAEAVGKACLCASCAAKAA